MKLHERMVILLCSIENGTHVVLVHRVLVGAVNKPNVAHENLSIYYYFSDGDGGRARQDCKRGKQLPKNLHPVRRIPSERCLCARLQWTSTK